jgi:mono/diheme cytochrome c family protein
LEGLWVSWGINKIDEGLLEKLAKAKDSKVRAAATHVARFTGKYIKNQQKLLVNASKDVNGRVRMEALAASTWLNDANKQSILSNIGKRPMDDWLKTIFNYVKKPSKEVMAWNLLKTVDKNSSQFSRGQEIYNRDGYCVTCHQPDGKGLESSDFPPLTNSKWVTGNPDRLIKLVIHGIYGPMEVNGKKYPGNVPMTPYGGLLNDEELASVLNYIRNSFGNSESTAISANKVKEVREETIKRKGFFTPQELLKDHPDE